MNPIALRTPGDIGALIRDRRRALGLGQSELAELIGVSRLWINQVERGKPGAGIGLVLRALTAAGVEITGADVGGAGHPSPGAPVISPDINAIVARARGKSRP